MSGRRRVPIRPATVELWSLPTAEAAPTSARAALGELLDVHERERAAAFRFERDREQFVQRRAMRRLVLAHATGLDPAAITTDVPRGRKPALPTGPARPGPGGPDFNPSHTPGWAVLAVSRTAGCRVGVDVERVRELPDFDLVAPTVFTPAELDRWSACSMPERPALFFRIWTRKEALLKAEGFGLAIAPATVDVPLDPEQPGRAIRAERRVPGSASTWWLVDRMIAPDVRVSLAIEGDQPDPADADGADDSAEEPPVHAEPLVVPAALARALPGIRATLVRLGP